MATKGTGFVKVVLAAILAALVLSVAACNRDETVEDADGEDAATAATPSSTAPQSTTSTADHGTEPSEPETTTVEASDSVVERPDRQPLPEAAGNWIGTAVMADDRIELAWALDRGSEPEEFGIYRFAHRGALPGDPEAIALEAGELIFTGTDSPESITSFNDTDVETGMFYTYVLAVSSSDDESVVRRWTTGLAVTDTTPPSPIVGLVGQWNDDGVTLSWQPSSDNVEFASYSVSTVEEDGELSYLGGGADASLANFHDPAPASSPITYAVEAVDFHHNRTEPVTITLNR